MLRAERSNFLVLGPLGLELRSRAGHQQGCRHEGEGEDTKKPQPHDWDEVTPEGTTIEALASLDPNQRVPGRREPPRPSPSRTNALQA